MIDSTQILIPVHTKVPGRARFKIKSVALSPGLIQWIDSEVRRLPAVNGVRINSVTGSLFVFFDPEEDWRVIAARIGGVMESLPASDAKPHRDEYEEADRLPAFFRDASEGIHEWHAFDVDRILAMVDTSIDQGLDTESVHHRIRVYGFNVIDEARLRKPGEILKDQFMFLPMVLLLAESVAALFGGAVVEAVLLSAINAVNVLAGYLIDCRAEQTLAEFKHRPRPPAQVLRCGSWIEVAGEELVVGDVVKLTPGTYVGADCRIVSASCLKIDESIFTDPRIQEDGKTGGERITGSPTGGIGVKPCVVKNDLDA